MKRAVSITGNTRRPSKTRLLAEHIATEIGQRADVDVELFDLVDAGPGVGAFAREQLPQSASDVLQAIEEADALIVGSPVYKGAYAGLLKHLFDFVDPFCIAGKPVLLMATGGGDRHALMGEHSLRPLFGFFAALTMPTYVYASDRDFRDGALCNPAVIARAAQAASELADCLDRSPLQQIVQPAPPILMRSQS